eukprot:COSAG02_NODE_1031_length_15073_cov_13.084279_2_plen_856_part_00
MVLTGPATRDAPEDCQRVMTELTALIDDDTTKAALKTAAPLLTYRSLAYARQSKTELALQDVMDVLDEQPKNALALRMQAGYQLKRAETMESTTGRYVEPAKSLYQYLGICPSERPVLAQFDSTVREVQRDRPFSMWWQPLKDMDKPMPRDEEKPRGASHWDYVLERVQDLFVDDIPQDDGTVKHGADHAGTRDVLLGNIDMILSVYDFYVRLGAHTETTRDELEEEMRELQGDITGLEQKLAQLEDQDAGISEAATSQEHIDASQELEAARVRLRAIRRSIEDTTWKFRKIEPKTIDLEHMDAAAMETFQRMFMDAADEALIAKGTVVPWTPPASQRKTEIDTTGDGKLDTFGYDTNGDGTVDAYDTTGDGTINITAGAGNKPWMTGKKIVGIDTTGDGKPNVFGYDTTGDGEIDSYDTTGDGTIDTRASGAGAMDAAIPVDRPDTLINLRQFRQLCLDCKLLCSSCQMADVGRIFLYSSREDTTSEKGGYELSEVDEQNPHFSGNSNHVYEYVEALVRVSHAIFLSKSKNGSKTLADCFQRLISDHLLPFSCEHESMDSVRWVMLSGKVQHVVRKFKSSLEQVFRYYAVDKTNQKEVMKADMDRQAASAATHRKVAKPVEFHAFWKIHSYKMLDDTMSFNELYFLLDTLQLIDSKLTPKKAAHLYGTVTMDTMIDPNPLAKANQTTELVLDEFVELVVRMAIMRTGGLKGGKKGSEAIEERVEDWLLTEFLERASLSMPKSTTREWALMQALHDGSESSDSEEETEMVAQRKKRLLSGRVLNNEDRRGDGITDKVYIDTTGDGNADVIGFDTTGDGKIDAYDTTGCVSQRLHCVHLPSVETYSSVPVTQGWQD